MDFAAGAATGAGVLLALAGVVFVLFPHVWPRPAVVAALENTADAPLPPAVAPTTPQQGPMAARTASGRGDAMPMTATLQPRPQPAPAPAEKQPAVPAPPGAAEAPAASPPPPARQRTVEEPPPVEEVSLAGGHAIYLASFPDRDLAESGWRILERRYAKGLTGLKPEIVEGKDRAGKRVWRLFAGPLRTQADAVQRCRALSFGSVNCKPADFTRGVAGATGEWEG